MAFLLGSALAQETGLTFSDSLSTAAGSRVSGRAVSGEPLESGDATWQMAVSSPVFWDADSGASFATPGGQDPKCYAFVPLPEASGPMTLRAKINPIESDWVALGFGKGDEAFFTSGVLWVLLRSSGEYAVFEGSSHALLPQAGPAPGFRPDAGNEVELKIQRPENTVRVLINSTEVANLPITPETAANLVAAGFGFNGGRQGVSGVSDFHLTIGNAGAASPPSSRAIGNTEAAAFFVSADFFSSTNMALLTFREKQPILSVQTAAGLNGPYFVRYQIPVPSAGRWTAWAVTMPRGVPWASPYSAKIDGRPADAQTGRQSLEAADGPRWENLGSWDLDQQEHTLEIQVDQRRSHPDDAYLFKLWKILLVKDDAFVPEKIVLDLEHNPQVFQGYQTSTAGRDYGNIPLLRRNRQPVVLEGTLTEAKPVHAPIWRDYSQGGAFSDPAFLFPRFVKALRPRIIRKDHCLDSALRRNPDGSISYDFSEGLIHIETILALGAQPIIGLDQFPNDLTRGLNQQALATDQQFLREWGDLVAAFARYLTIEKRLPVRYFQHFNEPDFSGFGNALDSVVATYIAAARAIKKTIPDALVGGAGSGQGAASPLNLHFLRAMAQHPDLLDFFDFHIYQSTPHRLAQDIRKARQLLSKAKLSHAQLAITEWGVSSGETPDLAATAAAVYNASQIKVMLDNAVDIGALFCLVDPWKKTFPEELPVQYGIITQEGWLKPAYWAQWLWSRLPDDGRRIPLKGEAEGIEAVAFAKDATLHVLIWNGAPHPAPARAVRVNLRDVPSAKQARVTRYLVDDFHSIPWLPEGVPVALPPISETNLQVIESSLALDVTLEPQALTLVTAQWK